MTVRDRAGFLALIGKVVTPEKVRLHLHGTLLKAGLTHSPYKVFGAMVLACMALDVILLFGLIYYFDLAGIGALFFGVLMYLGLVIVSLLLAAGSVYVYLDIAIFRRVKNMEAVFADFLTVVSENLRSGMTVDKALWNAIKPEFGVLSKEIKICAKQVMTGGDIEDALMELAKKYDSLTMRRALTLISEAMKSGSELAGVVDQLADNIRESYTLKQQMMANAVSYSIFISLIVLGIAPGLFSLAYHLLMMMETFGKSLTQTASVSSMISFGAIAVSLDDFRFFSQLCLVVIAVFSSMIVSIISKGDIKSGAKYIPIFVVVSLVVYNIAMGILTAAFASFM